MSKYEDIWTTFQENSLNKRGNVHKKNDSGVNEDYYSALYNLCVCWYRHVGIVRFLMYDSIKLSKETQWDSKCLYYSLDCWNHTAEQIVIFLIWVSGLIDVLRQGLTI